MMASHISNRGADTRVHDLSGAITESQTAEIAEMRTKREARQAKQIEDVRNAFPIHPIWMAHCLNEVKNRNAIVVNELGMPAGTEFLDTITPQYTADLVSWGAIGARTTESQIHRELASGLSCPVGFKNGTDGNIRIAVDAIKAAASPHHFLSVTKEGQSAIVSTAGNEDCHVILRGGKTPNYDTSSVNAAATELAASGLAPKIMIDCSHANSLKQYKLQLEVAKDIAEQLKNGDDRIVGVMVESHLNEGRQDHTPGCNLEYGKSITDACLGWDDTLKILATLAEGVRERRKFHQNDLDE